MRIKLLSFLLITSFLLGSVPPVFAQETPAVEPVTAKSTDIPQTTLQTEEPVVETPAIEEPAPIEIVEPLVIEEIPVEISTSSEPVVENIHIPEITEESTSTPESFITLTIRHGEQVAWTGTTTLPSGGTMLVTPTGSAEEIEIATDSLLGVLLTLDEASAHFSVTDLDYYPSFDSFIVNCISATAFNEACAQWQYVIDGQYPFTGIDKYELQSGDEVFLYFGSPRRVILADTSIGVNESFTATAQSYDPATNAYSSLPGYTIGITQPNPLDPWTPLEVATSTSASDGTAVFTLSSEGSYDIGLKEDFYFPATALTVSSTTDNGSGGTTEPGTDFDFSAAYAFLRTGQDGDGAWESDLVTDWSAIALAVSGAPSDMKSALADYLRTEDVDLDTVRDYERHAMALMALNIDPYTGGQEDYVTPIVESFDGTQIDDPTIVNDDAFALIVLLNAGYSKNDEIIQKIAAFIVSEQRDDGSWEGGVDVSGPYIQALAKVSTLPGVGAALMRAEAFLRSEQEEDGGFGDPFATAWTIQGIRALGGSPETWTKDGNTPLTYLINAQEEDGGISTTPDDYATRAWATAYSIPAMKGVTWDSVLRNFRKPTTAPDTDESTEDTAPVISEATVETLVLPVPVVPETPEEAAVVTAPVVIATEQEVVTQEATDIASSEQAQETNPLTASAIDSGAWPWLKRLFTSLWSALVGLFA